MGLDHAIGVLQDRSGDDAYRAESLAQGASTAAGLGVLVDDQGSDRFETTSGGWGARHWSGGIPGLGALIGSDARDVFMRDGQRAEASALPLGPMSGEISVEGPADLRCPDPPRRVAHFSEGEALAMAFPYAGEGEAAISAHWAARHRLSRDPDAVVRAVGANEVRALGLLGVLRCAFADLDHAGRERLATRLGTLLSREQLPHAWAVAGALARSDTAVARSGQVVEALARQHDCSGLVVALELIRTQRDSDLSSWQIDVLRHGLATPCWRARARAIRLADERAPEFVPEGLSLPTFLSSANNRRAAFPAGN